MKKFNCKICNKIIEFNGDYWHCNPKIYKKNVFNKTMKKTAEEVWKRDQEKIDFIKSIDCELLIIWENDYKKNKNEIIKQCQRFINE